jgi:aminoglycoside phosphotransferase (APT) family kinase protein
MTHGDLHPRNIIVDDKNDVRITGVIDWEKGGGYPEYWEYLKALNTVSWTQKDDWHLFLPEESIGRCNDEYARDYIIEKMLV